MSSVFSRRNCDLLIGAFGWKKGATGGDNGTLNHLKGILAAFVLRRLKRDVLDQLSEKRVVVEKLDMTNFQKQVYDNILFGHANR